jgi:hypothetical protein
VKKIPVLITLCMVNLLLKDLEMGGVDGINNGFSGV